MPADDVQLCSWSPSCPCTLLLRALPLRALPLRVLPLRALRRPRPHQNDKSGPRALLTVGHTVAHWHVRRVGPRLPAAARPLALDA